VTTDESDGAERRRIVLHPRTAAARKVDRTRAYGSHVRGYNVQTDDVMALMVEQRRASLRYLAAFITPLALTLAAMAVFPGLAQFQVGRVPLLWLVLGPLALYSTVLIAWRHDRFAERRENQWSQQHREDRT